MGLSCVEMGGAEPSARDGSRPMTDQTITAPCIQVDSTTLRAVKSPLEQLPTKEKKKKAS